MNNELGLLNAFIANLEKIAEDHGKDKDDKKKEDDDSDTDRKVGAAVGIGAIARGGAKQLAKRNRKYDRIEAFREARKKGKIPGGGIARGASAYALHGAKQKLGFEGRKKGLKGVGQSAGNFAGGAVQALSDPRTADAMSNASRISKDLRNFGK